MSNLPATYTTPEAAFSMQASSALSGADAKSLVCIFFSGGIDSHNMLIPHTEAGATNPDPAAALRRSQYEVARPVPEVGIPNADLLPLRRITDGTLSTNPDETSWGLHPSMTFMSQAYAGTAVGTVRMAALTHVGTLNRPMTREEYLSAPKDRPDQLFAHNIQQELWHAGLKPGDLRTTGWFGRTMNLVDTYFNGSQKIPFGVVSVGGESKQNLGFLDKRGVGVPALTPGQGSGHGLSTFSAARDRMKGRTKAYATSKNKMYEGFSSILINAEDEQAIVAASYRSLPTAENNLFTNLPSVNNSSNPIREQMRNAARAIYSRSQEGFDQRRQMIYINFGGWDHHSSLRANQDTRLKHLDNAIAAFWEALTSLGLHNEVVLFTESEFSRTFQSNGTGGTDHGWAGHCFVMGPSVQAGIYGPEPDYTVNGPRDTSKGCFIPDISIEQYYEPMLRWFGIPESVVPLVLPNRNAFGASYSFMGSALSVGEQGLSILNKYGLSSTVLLPGAQVPVLGPELVTNGGFDNATGWSSIPANVSITNGMLQFASPADGASVNGGNILTIGKEYEVTFTLRQYSGGAGFRVLAGTASGTTPATVRGRHTFRLSCAGNTTLYLQVMGTGVTCHVDDVSVREVVAYQDLVPGLSAATFVDSTAKAQAVIDDPVGFVGDSQPGYGPELAPPTTSLTGWNSITGSVVNEGSSLRVTNTLAQEGYAQLAGVTPAAGKIYEVRVNVLGATNGGVVTVGSTRAPLSGSGLKRVLVRAGSSSDIRVGTNAADLNAYVYFKDLSVKEVDVSSLGPNVVVNGGFDDTSWWTTSAGTAIADGKLSVVTAGEYVQCVRTSILNVGQIYYVEADVVINSGASGVNIGSDAAGITRTTTGKLEGYFVATQRNIIIKRGNSGVPVDALVDNVVIRPVMGLIPAVSASTTMKPILRRGAVNRVRSSSALNARLGDFNSGVGLLPAGWTWGSISTATITREVVAMGTLPNGRDYVDIRVHGTNNLAGPAYPDIYFMPTTSVPSIVGETWTAGVDLEILAGSTSGFSVGSSVKMSIAEMSSAGSYLTGSTAATGAAVGGGMVRSTVTRTFTHASTATAASFVSLSVPAGGVVDITLRISAPQLELGSAASDYIPTFGAVASSPTGVQYLEFDGINDEMLMTASPLQPDEDGVIIMALTPYKQAGSYSRVLSFRSDSQNDQLINFEYEGGTGRILTTVQGVGGVGGQVLSPLNSLPAHQTNVVTYVRRGSNSQLRINNATFDASLDNRTLTVPGPTRVKNAALGRDSSGAFGHYAGKVHAVIVLKGTVTDAEIATMNAWIAQLSGK